MFEKTLTDIVKGIRASKRDTALYISQCIAEIKTEINDSDMFVKANALQKLTFLQMMGYGMSWASFATIEVMSSPRFAHKRIGYLAASQGFTQDTDVILLTTNLLKKELRSAVGGSMNGVYEAGLAVNCVSNIVTEELAQDLLPELTGLTQHPQPYLRKKAILCLFKLFVKYPQGLRLTFGQIQNCMNDSNSAVVSCAVNVITELSDKNPKNYLHLAPAFFDLLTTSSNNWMLIKVVKLLGSLVPEEPRLARKLLEPLADIVRNTPAKSLLYEAVHAITLCLPYCRKNDGSMPASVPEIVALCAQTLKTFVEEKDQNLKYLGLVGFGSLIQSHPKVLSAPGYRPLILACLSDEDVTIRTRALGLLPGMASRKNVIELVTQLLQHVELASGDYKLELVRIIVEICCGEKYALLPDFSWYLDTLFKLGHMRGLDTHADLLRQQVIDVALRVLPVRAFAVKRSIEILLEGEQINVSSDFDSDNGRGKHIMPEILPALGWIVGEYSALIPEVLGMDTNAVFIYNTESEGPYHSIIQVLSSPSNHNKLPASTQKIYVQGAMKVFAAACSNAQVSDIELESCCKTLGRNLPVFMQSTNCEVQERAITGYSLLQSLKLYSNGDVFSEAPPLVSVEDEESDGDGVTDEIGNLLDMKGLPSMPSALTSATSIKSIGGSLASRCRTFSETLNYLWKPSPMKPNGVKAQRKKYGAPIGVETKIDGPVDLAVFSIFLEEEKKQRLASRLTLEAVSFTQQRPLHVAERNMNIMTSSSDPMTSEELPSVSMNGLNGNTSSSFQQQSSPMAINTGIDRPKTASDPFYLSAAPQAPETQEDQNLQNRFGMIQLGNAESDDDERIEKKKWKKKKKDKKSKKDEQDVDLGSFFGGNVTTSSQDVAVYTSDDDDEDDEGPASTSRVGRSIRNKEFDSLANMDLTTPLTADEVMPERKHRVVPERVTQHGFSDAPTNINDTKKSKPKKKKKESKKSSKKRSHAQHDVGDLLDLAFSSDAKEITAKEAEASSAPDSGSQSLSVIPTMQQGNAITSAFDDLLGFSDNTPLPQFAGTAPALIEAGDVDSNISSQTLEFAPSLSQHPWMRGTIKSSHASGRPSVEWSKIHLLFKVFNRTGEPSAGTSVSVRVQNEMDMTPLQDTKLELSSVGTVSIGDVQPGSFKDSTQIGPFLPSNLNSPFEMKGVLSSGDCRVPVKIYLPISMDIAPLVGLTLEDIAQQLASSQWTTLSAKIPISSASSALKTSLANFLNLCEVEPTLSGPSNGTFAGKSISSNAQIRLLAKVKKGKVKMDLKVTDAQIGQKIISDLKRLVL